MRRDTAHALAVLEAQVVLAEFERAVIAAEAEAGRSVPNARRPLTEAEFASGVRFGDINALVQKATQQMVDAAQTVTDHLLDRLPDMTRGKSQAQIIAMLTRLASPSTGLDVPGIDPVLADATATAEAALRDAWTSAAQGVLDEATSQGATDLPDRVDVDEDTDEAISTAATQVIDTWVARALGAALQAARRWTPPAAMSALSAFDIVEAIRQAVVGVSMNSAADVGRQAAHQTVAASRGSQAQAPGMPPVREVYASELLDTNTCDPCAAVDGTNYASLEEAWQAYRRNGGYQDCEGGLRCRGVLVIVWDTENAPSVRDTPPPPQMPVTPVPPPPPPPPQAPATPQQMPYDLQPGVEREDFAQRMGRRPKAVKENVQQDLQDSFTRVAAQDVKVRVPGEAIDRVLEEGRFRNAWEVGRAADNPDYMEMRSNIEGRFIGVPEQAAVADRPIYGAMHNYASADRYGDVTVVLRDEVKDRTTLAVGDSFNGVNPVNVRSVLDGTANVDDLARAVSDFEWRGIVRGERSILDATSQYWEAQVHGGISVADIKSLEVTAGWLDGLTPATRAALERSGIDVIVVG